MSEKITIAQFKGLGSIKKTKYRNTRVQHVNGDWFDSKKELSDYVKLLLLERQGFITDLKRQVPFDLTVNSIKICTYRCDFTYYEKGDYIVHDTKGVITPEFKLKQKLMLACHGIKIKIS